MLSRSFALLLTILLLALATACSGGAKRAVAPTVAPSATAVTHASPVSSGVTASSTATAAAPAAAATPSTATADAPQTRLDGALLGSDDLPPGFAQSRTAAHVGLLSGADASAVAVFARAGGGAPGAEQVVASLSDFRDALSAASGLGQAQTALMALTNLPGASLALAAVPSDTAIGDGTQTFRIAGALAGVGISGFAVYWRHGNIVAGVAEFGVDASILPPDVDALARAQDTRLAASGF